MPLNFTLLQQERSEGREVYLIKVETEPLEPGTYRLYFQADEIKTSSRSKSTLTFPVVD